MKTSGAALKDEITNNNRVVGLNKNLKTIFTGGVFQASQNGNEIVMPMVANNTLFDNRQVRVFRGIGDHESLHSRLTPSAEWKEVAEYCAAANDSHNISMKVLNAMEDVRIERLGMETHPGIHRNLQTTVDALIEAQEESADPKSNPAFALPAAITWMGRERNGLHIELPPKLEGKQKSLSRINGLDDLVKPDSFDDLLFTAATFMHDQLGNRTLLNYLDGVSVEKTKQENEKPNTGGEAPESMQKALNGKQGKVMESGVHVAQACLPKSNLPYHVAEDSIEHIKVMGQGGRIEIPHAIQAVGRGFAISLKSTLLNRKNVTRHQNYLDKRKLVQAFQGKEKVWSKKNNLDRGFNTAVSFVVDHSGSMRNDIRHVMQLVGSLGLSVQSVNVPFEVTGFSTIGHEYSGMGYMREGKLRLTQYSDFNERIDLEKLNRCNSYTNGYTPDTEALELAIMRINAMPQKRKIVIILTDGHSENGLGHITVQGEHVASRLIFANHRRAVLEQAKKDGVEVFAIMVGDLDASGYEPNHVLNVRNFAELEQKVFRLFFNVIAGGGK